MTAAALAATLRSDLDRAALRLKLAVAHANWADAVFYAEEAARLETELAAARQAATPEEKKVASFV